MFEFIETKNNNVIDMAEHRLKAKFILGKWRWSQNFGQCVKL